jgi:4-aminobutyrate aminotransferase-like enzyme
MSTGFPISACVGSERVMRAWGPATGEARHTSTFLGHPLGCAMTLATIRELKRRNLVGRAAKLGLRLERGLRKLAASFPRLVKDVRGRGLMWGLELAPGATGRIVKAALKEGLILLASGERSETLGFTPPLVTEPREIDFSLRAVGRLLERL